MGEKKKAKRSALECMLSSLQPLVTHQETPCVTPSAAEKGAMYRFDVSVSMARYEIARYYAMIIHHVHSPKAVRDPQL